jgi:hypothetical protein
MDKSDVDVIQLFSNYSAGELDKAALIRQVRQKQLARDVGKGKLAGQKMWWKVTNPTNSLASINVVAASKEQAIAKAVEPNNYPDWARVQNTLRATPLRPYQEPDAKPAQDQTGNWGIWINALDRFANEPGSYARNETPTSMRFPSQAAAEQWIEQQRVTRPNLRNDIEVREIEPSQPIPGSTLDLQRQRAAPQTLTRPGQGQQTFTGTWLVLDPQDREIYRFSGVGNSQSDANRVAMNWMRQHPGAMQAGVTVVPEMQ